MGRIKSLCAVLQRPCRISEQACGGGAADADAATLESADYKQAARTYFANCGLSEDEINQLVRLITK